MKLTVVIPAYNEEEAIGSIIERTLAARDHIIAQSPVQEVEVIVVSDGSTDRTAQIAAGYDEVELIEFEHNRGYGAAIKRGFEEGTGELLGFLDADGTCDPRFFADLSSAVIGADASVALGSRMGPGSKMPPIRRLGNRVYALMLSFLSDRPVTDTASGMRVIRRDSLAQLYPLPDGMNFTPAMSARALLDDSLKIVELPMSYQERVGESKLHVWRDGLAFFKTIAQTTLVRRPSRIFVPAAAICLLAMVVLTAHPAEMWIRTGRLQEDMIYRLLFCSLLGSFGAVLLSATVLTDALQELTTDRPSPRNFVSLVLDYAYSLRVFTAVMALGLPLLAWLVGGGVVTLITDGHVYVHWSRVVLAGLLAFALAQMLVTILIADVMRFHTPKNKAHAYAPKSANQRDIAPMNFARPPATAPAATGAIGS